MTDFRLKVFLSVAKYLSFTKASAELFISQPAVTRHIKELETEYEVRLFDREGSHIFLTEAGRLFLKHAQTLIDDYRHLEYDMNLLHSQYNGELKLGASTTIAQYVLPSVLASFASRYPKVNLTMMNGNSRDVETALTDKQIDIGLVEGVAHSPNLKYTAFLKDELVAVVDSKSHWAQTEEMKPEELLRIPLVLREQGSGTLDVIEQALGKHHIKLPDLHVLMYLGSTESIKRFITSTECMGIVSIRSIERELKDQELQVIEIEDMPMTREFSFVQLQGGEEGLPQLFMNYALHEAR